MIEHERSYVFTREGVRLFLSDQGISWPERSQPKKSIEDYYLPCGLRIRMVEGQDFGILTHKEGDKADGYRIEKEEKISLKAAEILAEQHQLHVSKKRYEISIDTSKIERPNDANVTVILDLIEKPMRLAVMEIEAVSESLYPLPADIARRLFEVDLTDCPLSTFDYFTRKIGICGGPSSGKSETANSLSHRINTEFGGNAFHVAEFATTFIQKYHRSPTFQDQFFIWYGQHEREEDADTANIIVSDCPTFLAYIYLLHLNREKYSPQAALYCSKLYKRALFDIQSYSNLVFLELENYAENNIRYQSETEARKIEERIQQFLDDHCIPYKAATCHENDRLFNELFWINTYESET